MPLYSFVYLLKQIRIIITKSKLHIEKLKLFFNKNDNFTTQDIWNFYKKFEHNIKHTTINWRIYTLTQMGVITRIGRGKYTFKTKTDFIPEISRRIKLFNNKLKKKFPFLTICLWNSSLINEFSIHQANKSFLLIEVDRETTQSIFYFLKGKNYKVFLEPSIDTMEKYVSDEENAIIVKSLISEAPIQKIKDLNTVTLEKLLVDVFCDKTIFLAYQGNEMKTIFTTVFKKYIVNENKLLRYANRRGRKEEIWNYLKQINGNY